MCLIIKGAHVALKARTDIIVFKKLRRRKEVGGNFSNTMFSSIHFNFKYMIGYQYKNDNFPLAVPPSGLTLGKEGLHSYPLSNLASFRPYSSLFEKNGHFRLVECIIPKGTPYYRGKNNDIISEELVIEKVITRYRLNKLLKDNNL